MGYGNPRIIFNDQDEFTVPDYDKVFVTDFQAFVLKLVGEWSKSSNNYKLVISRKDAEIVLKRANMRVF